MDFPANAQRFDPYKNFKFLVKWDGHTVAGVSKVTGLKRTTEVIKHRIGGDPSSSRKSPGRTEYEPLTLERGLTHDVDFEQWANKVWNYGSGLGAEVSLKDFRKDIRIELLDEAGRTTLAYTAFRCWVSEWRPCPTSTRTRTRLRSSTSSSRTRGGSATTRSRTRRSRASRSPRGRSVRGLAEQSSCRCGRRRPPSRSRAPTRCSRRRGRSWPERSGARSPWGSATPHCWSSTR